MPSNSLKEIALFKNFTDDELVRFAEAVETLRMNPGDILFNDGDPGDALYIIEEGAIRIFKVIDPAKGMEKSLALLERGTYLGEMTIIGGEPRSASARAETPSVVLKLTRNDFHKLARAYPQAAIRLFVSFMQVLSDRLRKTNDELVVLYEVGKIIGAAPPLAELIQSILERTMTGARALFGVFFKVNEITAQLEVVEAVGPGYDDVLRLKTKVTEGLAGAALKKKIVWKIDVLDADPEASALPRFGYERQAMIIAPLLRQNNPIGALLLGDPIGGPSFNTAHLNLVQAVSSQAAAALENAMLHADTDAREKHDRHFFRF